MEDKNNVGCESGSSPCSGAGVEETRSERREQEDDARCKGEPLPVWFVRNIAPTEDVGSLYRRVLGKPQPESLEAAGFKGLYEW